MKKTYEGIKNNILIQKVASEFRLDKQRLYYGLNNIKVFYDLEKGRLKPKQEARALQAIENALQEFERNENKRHHVLRELGRYEAKYGSHRKWLRANCESFINYKGMPDYERLRKKIRELNTSSKDISYATLISQLLKLFASLTPAMKYMANLPVEKWFMDRFSLSTHAGKKLSYRDALDFIERVLPLFIESPKKRTSIDKQIARSLHGFKKLPKPPQWHVIK